VDNRQVQDLKAARQNQKPKKNPQIQLPKTNRAASEHQEKHSQHRHVKKAPSAAKGEHQATNGQARHPNPPDAGRGTEKPNPYHPKTQKHNPNQTSITKSTDHPARAATGTNNLLRTEAAGQDRAVP